MSASRILIVEDEAILAGDLEDMLQRLGYGIAGIAAEGEAAIRLASELRPDLVLMDIRLAGPMDGITAAGYIQLLGGPPVVFLTAHADDETLQRARITEPFGYLHKPVQERDLRTAIEMAVYKHRSEQQLRHSEEQHRTTLNSIGEGVISVDLRGRVALMNPEAERITGWSQDEATGVPLECVLPLVEEETGKPICSPAAEVLARQRIVKLPTKTVLLTRDGRKIPVEDEASPIEEIGRGVCAGVVVTFRDVTDFRRTEDALLQARKLESLGVLAAGIAHDFNNLLTPIVGYGELLALRLAHDREGEEMVAALQAAAADAARLTQQMLAYAGKGTFAIVPLDLSALVREMMILIQANVSKKTTFRLELDDQPTVIAADSTQIRQVILNLLTNASEALDAPGQVKEAGGTILIRTRTQFSTREDLVSSFVQPPPPLGEFVVLEVSDNGCGMTEETLGRLFDPFFTTKFQGRGLGLSAVLGIVRAHGGTLTVHSRTGEGSTFRVYLPHASGIPAQSVPPATAADLPTTGTVLVADDDPLVRTLTDRLLRRAGVTTILVRDGHEAVEVYQQRRTDIDAVLLDVMMPRLNGLETLAALRLLNPAVRVVLMSGYSTEDVAQRLAGHRPVGLLQKPFTPGRLLAEMRKVLNVPPVSASSP